MKKRSKETMYLETADTDEHEFKIRTPPKQHSPVKVPKNEGYEMTGKYINHFDFKNDFQELDFYSEKCQSLSENDLSDIRNNFLQLNHLLKLLCESKSNNSFRSKSPKLSAKMLEKTLDVFKEVYRIENNFQVIAENLCELQMEICQIYDEILS
ncbi:hypothetical protein SteCoe_13559 [Stentor coeruleus]|uniref:Uncharacterized protein n=1 Tax=Stentor coeruleus TaxID=5963 RepID=A0A1R2C825_9CILI|nr:hypothetical protein SteCoe_13559 [Stentor coeruleus]